DGHEMLTLREESDREAGERLNQASAAMVGGEHGRSWQRRLALTLLGRGRPCAQRQPKGHYTDHAEAQCADRPPTVTSPEPVTKRWLVHGVSSSWTLQFPHTSAHTAPLLSVNLPAGRGSA